MLMTSAIKVGSYVVARVPENSGFVANWIQVGNDYGFVNPASIARVVTPSGVLTEAARHRAEAAALRAMPNASESTRPGSPGTAAHCDRIADRLDSVARISAPAAARVPVPAAACHRKSVAK